MSDAHDLLRELRRLAARFPTPHPSWHRHVPEMRFVVADLAAAIAALETLPAAQVELVRRVDGAGEPVDPGPALAAALARLHALPVPEGEHPYLDEIVVTLEAAGHALAALASVEGGEGAFADSR